MDETEFVVTSWAADRPRLQPVRREVFVTEQRVPEAEEWDDDDQVCVHVLALQNREPVGTGRISPAGKIGRLAVLSEFRGRGIGDRILLTLIEQARHRGLAEVTLNAQVHAMPFYERHGFKAQGEVFDEAGIPHRRMQKALG
jgi:predicted GNAT family N-acyltransferase